MSLTIGDVVAALEERYPAHRAEAWDRSGLLVGDASEPLTGVALSLDPSATAIKAAREAGANLLLTHHPAFLKSPDPITAGPGARGIAYLAAREGVALACAHTNLDRDPRAQETLPDALGLNVLEPLERSSLLMSKITTFAPGNSAQTLIAAMTAAGAGRVGEYEGASYTVEGEGQFTPGSLAHPAIGTAGHPTATPETRIETVCAPALTGAVLAAARAAHPYEEPLIIATEVAIARGEHRLGRVSEPASPMTLGKLVSHAEIGRAHV